MLCVSDMFISVKFVFSVELDINSPICPLELIHALLKNHEQEFCSILHEFLYSKWQDKEPRDI